MANSVVKVSDIKDDALDDNLFLLVGEDGTVAPDQETVENYLKQRSGPTNIQIMKINHSEKQAIDISVDSVTYMPDVVSEEVVSETVDMEEVERNLHNFRLDHDYTPFTSPKGSPSPPMEEEEDELAKTLSILDGPNPAALIPISPTKPPPLVMTNHQKVNKAPKVKLIQSITLTPSKHIQQMVKSNNVVKTSEGFKDQGDIDESVYEQKGDPETSQMESEPLDDSDGALSQKDIAKGRAKVIKTYKPAQKSTPKPRKEKPKPKPKLEESEDDDSDYTDGDFDMEMEDDENDSDFEIKDVKTPKRTSRRTKSESKTTPQRRKLKNKEKETNKKLEKEDEEKTSKERHRDKSPDKIKVQDKGKGLKRRINI